MSLSQFFLNASEKAPTVHDPEIHAIFTMKRWSKFIAAHLTAYIKSTGIHNHLWSWMSLNACCSLFSWWQSDLFLHIVSFLLSLRTKITLWNSSWMPLWGTLWLECQQMVCPWRWHINHTVLSLTNPLSLFETWRLLKLQRLLHLTTQKHLNIWGLGQTAHSVRVFKIVISVVNVNLSAMLSFPQEGKIPLIWVNCCIIFISFMKHHDW